MGSHHVADLKLSKLAVNRGQSEQMHTRSEEKVRRLRLGAAVRSSKQVQVVCAVVYTAAAGACKQGIHAGP
jgi:hypothetical protein